MQTCKHGHTRKQHPACWDNSDVKFGVIFPDIHFPLHDARAYDLVMRFVADSKPDIIVNLGDVGHFSGISHWNTKKIKLRHDYPIKVDFDMCRNHYKDLRKVLPTADIYTCGGNHDQDWLESWIIEHPEMQGYMDYRRDMGFNEYKINYVPRELQPLTIGKANFVHGWYTNKHHAQKHAQAIHHNIIYGHAHDMQSFTPDNIEPNHRFMAWCMGHLSDEKKADYLRSRPTNWMLGFGIFWVEKSTGSFTLCPIPMPNYTFIFDGTVYK